MGIVIVPICVVPPTGDPVLFQNTATVVVVLVVVEPQGEDAVKLAPVMSIAGALPLAAISTRTVPESAVVAPLNVALTAMLTVVEVAPKLGVLETLEVRLYVPV